MDSLIEFLYLLTFDRAMLKEIVSVVFHVSLNALLTTFIWTRLYHAKCDQANLFSSFLWDTNNAYSTGNAFFDAIVNATFFVLFFALITFVLTQFVLMRLKRFIVGIVQFGHIFLSAFLPAYIVHDFLEAIGVEEAFAFPLQVILVILYSSIAYLTYFTDRFSSRMHQLFIVVNCSLASVIYIRNFPGYTIWLIFLLNVVWDLFSVRYEWGPLHNMIESANDYGEDMLRFMVFSVVEKDVVDCDCDADAQEEVESAKEQEDDEDPSLGSSIGNINEVKSAFEALTEGGTRLGMGDFVFFGLLVAKAWGDGHPFGALAALLGVSIGLIISFCTSSVLAERNEFKYLPALPFSLVLGMTLHFGCVFVAKVRNNVGGFPMIL